MSSKNKKENCRLMQTEITRNITPSRVIYAINIAKGEYQQEPFIETLLSYLGKIDLSNIIEVYDYGKDSIFWINPSGNVKNKCGAHHVRFMLWGNKTDLELEFHLSKELTDAKSIDKLLPPLNKLVDEVLSALNRIE